MKTKCGNGCRDCGDCEPRIPTIQPGSGVTSSDKHPMGSFIRRALVAVVNCHETAGEQVVGIVTPRNPDRAHLQLDGIFPSVVDTCVKGGLLADNGGQLSITSAGLAWMEDGDE